MLVLIDIVILVPPTAVSGVKLKREPEEIEGDNYLPYSGKFWREKTLANLSQSFPLAFSGITSNWRIKLWRIHSKLPNSPKFSPTKILRYTVND